MRKNEARASFKYKKDLGLSQNFANCRINLTVIFKVTVFLWLIKFVPILSL